MAKFLGSLMILGLVLTFPSLSSAQSARENSQLFFGGAGGTLGGMGGFTVGGVPGAAIGGGAGAVAGTKFGGFVYDQYKVSNYERVYPAPNMRTHQSTPMMVRPPRR